MEKKVPVLSEEATVERVVDALARLGYSYLDNSDFSARSTVHSAMSKKPYNCYYIRSRRIGQRTVDEIDVWKPEGKVYCEIMFFSDGTHEATTVTGKMQYNGKKADIIAEKNIFSE